MVNLYTHPSCSSFVFLLKTNFTNIASIHSAGMFIAFKARSGENKVLMLFLKWSFVVGMFLFCFKYVYKNTVTSLRFSS